MKSQGWSQSLQIVLKVIRFYFWADSRFVASYSLVNHSRIEVERLKRFGFNNSWAKEPEKSTTFDL